jgi:hypothetical protein
MASRPHLPSRKQVQVNEESLPPFLDDELELTLSALASGALLTVILGGVVAGGIAIRKHNKSSS